MKQGSTLFLKLVIGLMGIAALGFCIIALDQLTDSFDVLGYDRILLGMCATVIPFFIALYQGFKLLSYIDNNTAFSQASVHAFKVIKYCAIAVSAMYAAGLPYIYYVADRDDAPGVIVIALVFVLAPMVIAVFAAVLQKLLQSAIDIKSENELTV